ncbi:MAG: hypothetical protein ACOY0T_01690 [Myxococcota bacterium]
MLSLWRNRTARRAPELATVLCILVASLAACRKKAVPNKIGGPPAGSASAVARASEPQAAFACRALANGPALVLGSPPAKAPRLDDEQDEEDRDVELPFAVELGSARADAQRFAVGGLESQRGQNHAFVALTNADGSSGTRVELGRVFGDVEPPALAPHKGGFVAVIADSDASSVVLRLVALDPPFDEKSVRRGGEISGVRRDAAAFSFEISGSDGLVAFTKLEKGRGSVALARIDLEKLTPKGEVAAVASSRPGEMESPRLVKRAGGYLLAFIVRGAATPPKAALGKPSEYDAGLTEQTLVDEGPSAIEVVPLSESGTPTGAPHRITPNTAHVIAFEMAPTNDGGALVVYRDDHEGPGLARPGAEAVLVRPDGSTASHSWDLGETAGLPSLLFDATPPSGRPWAWLSVPSEAESRVTPLAANPLELGELKSAPELAASELLAAASGRLLRARTRGGQRLLSVVDCAPAAAP